MTDDSPTPTPPPEGTDLAALWALPAGTLVTVRGAAFGSRNGAIAGFDEDALVLRVHDDYVTLWRDEIERYAVHLAPPTPPAAPDADHAGEPAGPDDEDSLATVELDERGLPVPAGSAHPLARMPGNGLTTGDRWSLRIGGALAGLVSLALGPGALVAFLGAIIALNAGPRPKEFAKGMLGFYGVLVVVFGACLAVLTHF